MYGVPYARDPLYGYTLVRESSIQGVPLSRVSHIEGHLNIGPLYKWHVCPASYISQTEM